MSRTVHARFDAISAEVSPKLRHAISSSGPLQLKRRRDVELSELLCRVVAGQQLSVQAARTIWGRVVDRAGKRRMMDFIDAAEIEELRQCGMSRGKAKAMKSIGEAEKTGHLDIAELSCFDHDARSNRLMEIWGVGQWTADMVGISYFGDRDVWPETDVTVWKTLERLTSRRRKTSRTAALFAPHRTYLALYMWKIADAAPTAS